MSSKVNHALFDLIKSMTKSEKRYFKLISSRHTIGDENNYVRIFDYLDKLEKYNEEELFDHFKGESFLNRFSITKKRLYDHILSALDSFHTSGCIDAQLYTMLHSSKILFEKSLYDQSRRILNSAEKLARKHEKSHILLQVFAQRKKLMETRGYLDAEQQELQELFQDESDILTGVLTYNSLWMIKSQLFTRLSKKGVARCDKEATDYTTICHDLLQMDLHDIHGTESRYLYHHILSAYYYAIGQLEGSLKHLKLNLDLFGEDKALKIEPNKQFSVLTNAIYIADKLGDHRSSIMLLNQLKEFARTIKANEDLEIKLFSSISSIELSMNLRKGDFTSALNNAQLIEENLVVHDHKIAPIRRAFLEFKLAVVYIGCNDFNAALKWTNKILNDSELDKTEDIIGFTQLLDLLIHIELNHAELLPYTLKSVQRFFKTRNRLYSFEQVFLQFISKMIKCEDKFEMEDLWEELYNELESMTDDDRYESVALDYFDFKSWAESKLKQKAFNLIVKEKYNRDLRAAS